MNLDPTKRHELAQLLARETKVKDSVESKKRWPMHRALSPPAPPPSTAPLSSTIAAPPPLKWSRRILVSVLQRSEKEGSLTFLTSAFLDIDNRMTLKTMIWKTMELCGPYHPDLLRLDWGRFRARVNERIVSRQHTFESVWAEPAPKIEIVIT